MDDKKVEILLVEDDADLLELACRALQKAGLADHLFAVRDGAEAIDFILGQGRFAHRLGAPPPKVIFLDLKLPKVDGIEVLRELKSNASTRKIPVTMLTSSLNEGDLGACYELGVNSYMVKENDMERFTRNMSEAGHYWLALNRTPY